MAVLRMGLSDIGFCVFFRKYIYVGLMFWIRVVVDQCSGLCRFSCLRVWYKGQSLIEDLLFSCCEYFVAQVDYCVCGVRLLSSL